MKDAIKAVNYKYLQLAKKSGTSAEREARRFPSGLEKPEISIDVKGRNISFHSWRHFFCSQITQKIASEKVAKVSGHLTKEIFDKYADHIESKNIREVGNAITEVFENIILFPVKQAG